MKKKMDDLKFQLKPFIYSDLNGGTRLLTGLDSTIKKCKDSSMGKYALGVGWKAVKVAEQDKEL